MLLRCGVLHQQRDDAGASAQAARLRQQRQIGGWPRCQGWLIM